MKKVNTPPKFATWLLHRIYGDQLFDEISGDLLELYNERLQTNGKWSASYYYLKDVLHSFRNIGLKRKTKLRSTNSLAMVKNIFLIAFRSLKKRASYSLLNVVGLSISMTFAFLLFLYV